MGVLFKFLQPFGTLRFPVSRRRWASASSPSQPPYGFAIISYLSLLFLLMGVVARVNRYAINGAIWGDEAMLAFNLATRDWFGLTHMLDKMQTAPILFLWSERAMLLLLGSSEYALRLLPLFAGIAALFVFADFARRATSPLAAMLAIGLLAVARWPISLSATVKPYASDLLVAAVFINLAHRWWLTPTKLWPLVMLTIITPIALSASYTAVFVAGGVALFLLPRVWWDASPRVKGLYGIFVLLMVCTFCLNYLLHIHGQLEEQGRALAEFMRRYWADGFPPAEPIAFLRWAILINTGRLFAYPVGDANGGSVFTFLLFLWGIRILWRRGPRPLLVLLLVPFLLNFLAAVLGKYPYGGCCRLSQHLAPAICLIVGVAFQELIERFSSNHKAWLRNTAVVCTFLFGIGVAIIAVDLASPDHDPISAWSRGVHREITRHLRPGDRVILVSPRVCMDETLEWQLCRLGDRLAWAIPPDKAADASRIWLVSNVMYECDDRLEKQALDEFMPGRVEVGRVVYSIPRGHNLFINWRLTLICLARPEYAGDRPVFRASP